MKRILLSILVLVYMVVSTGMVIRVNYCMGNVSDISVLPVNKTPCSACGKFKSRIISKDCCSSDTKFFKLSNDQTQVEAAYGGIHLFSSGLVPDFALLIPAGVHSTVERNLFSHSPPRSPQIAIYLFDRSFLI